MKSITLKKHEDRRVRRGHLWVFSNEIQSTDGNPESGDVVIIRSHTGETVGKGFYHSHSLIAARLLTRSADEEIDFHYFHRRFVRALQLRGLFYPESQAFRLVHGESDFLPGLIVDKFNDYLSVQTFSLGMDKRMTLICDVLDSLFHPKGIVERNESATRTLEQLPQKKGVVRGALAPVVIEENGIHYAVDLLEGQKTGFFFDQRENRNAFRRYSHGMNVLDCFCNEGGFALNSARAGAASVTGVDISGPTIGRAMANARANGMSDTVRFVEKDCFEFLAEAHEKGDLFDVVNLDPPSFAKNKKTVVQAKQGYRDLHAQALKVLKPGGILATSSCSHHILEEVFLEIIDSAAHTAGRAITLLEWHGAAPDHPVLPSMPETRYLKFGIFRLD
jgi:23S rRNA (cytosine1962-C5)-methyltransferase